MVNYFLVIYQVICVDLIVIYFFCDCCFKDLCNLDIYLYIIDFSDVFCEVKVEIFKVCIINKNYLDVMYICNYIIICNECNDNG